MVNISNSEQQVGKFAMVEEGYGAEVLLEVVPLIALLHLHERIRQHDSEIDGVFGSVKEGVSQGTDYSE